MLKKDREKEIEQTINLWQYTKNNKNKYILFIARIG